MPKSFLARSSSFSSPPPPKTAPALERTIITSSPPLLLILLLFPVPPIFVKRVVVVLKAFILLLEGFCGIIAPKLVFVAFVLRIKVNILCVLEYSSCAIRVSLFGEFYPLFLKKNQAKWRKVLLVLLLEKEPISNRSPTEREKCVGVEHILCARVVRSVVETFDWLETRRNVSSKSSSRTNTNISNCFRNNIEIIE